MKIILRSPLLYLFLIVCFPYACSLSKQSPVLAGNVFYVDAENGNDNAAGIDENSAWKSLDKVNSVTFRPGSRLLFRSGQSWTGQLTPKGSGMAGSPIVVDQYGRGEKPLIQGNGAEATLLLNNQEYWEINNLDITNYNPDEEGGIALELWEAKNIADYVNADLPPKAEKNNSPKLGIKITANDRGAVRHIHLKNLVVHGVNGTIIPDGADENGASKNNGGIGFEITGNGKPTWFDGILVEGCVIRDVDRTGLFNRSVWDHRTLTENTDWVPSKNVMIRGNHFQRTGANALIVRVADGPIIEHNLFEYCAIKGSGNAAFSFNTDNAVWQYNECRFTKANIGDNDAGGIDSDYRSKNTLIQFNWLHDNDFGMLVTGGGGSFNEGTVVRYNIIERDGRKEHRTDQKKFAIKVSGGATHTKIYNNTIYTDGSQDSIFLVFHKKWSVWPAETAYYNNLFLNEKEAFVSLGGSTVNVFEGNIARGKGAPELSNIQGDSPGIIAAGTGPDGYKLRKGSAAAGAGRIVPENGGKDFFGNKVAGSKKPDVGAYNGRAL